MQRKNLRIDAQSNFSKALSKLPDNTISMFGTKLKLLRENPNHPSLRTHSVGRTPDGKTIYSCSINVSYRFTWQYGSEKNQIILRHIGSHKIYRNP
jgi:mRNA-degrading endonuclease YafQ of YafQ-DinJ toxin-antitoxin module